MDGHIHRAAALAIIDLDVVEVSSEAGILCGLDDNAIRASSMNGHRTCIAGEHERWTCTDWK